MKKIFHLLAFVTLIGTNSFAQKAAVSKPKSVPVSNLHQVANATTGLGTAFVGGWAAITNETVTFQKDNLGYVKIDGKVTVGSGNTVFTLPAEYRPKVTRAFLVPKCSAQVAPSYVRCFVNADGTVQVGNGDEMKAGEVISLDGVSILVL